MNYFIEGLQGAGKSTLVNRLAENLPNYQVFREGDYNPVELAWCAYLTREQYEECLEKYADIAGEIKAHSYVEGNRVILCYTRVITDIPGFHKNLEEYEIYNGRVDREEFERIILERYENWQGSHQILECSIFQNIIENQILYFEMSDDEIVDFYKRLKNILEDKEEDYKILYLEVEDIAEALNVIRKERVDADGNEMWYPLMLQFIENCPYSKHHNIKGFEGLVEHLRHRRDLELRILHEVFDEQGVVAKSKNYGDDLCI